MCSNFKAPPDWPEDKTFEQWKNEVDMWCIVTDLDVKKRAPALSLSLKGRKRDVAMEVSVETLNSDTGMKSLLDQLAATFDVGTT